MVPGGGPLCVGGAPDERLKTNKLGPNCFVIEVTWDVESRIVYTEPRDEKEVMFTLQPRILSLLFLR